MRDLAFLSMARTYYSASVRLDENNAPTIDSTKLSRRGQVLEQGRRRQRVLARRALRGVVGLLHGRRLRARARQHPHDPVAVLPELVLPGGGHPQGASSTSRTASTTTPRSSSRKFQAKYQPIYDELDKVLDALQGRRGQDEPFYKFLKDVRDGKADLPPRIKIVVENALSDRQLLRNLEYVQVLDDEGKRFKKAPGELPRLAARQRRQGRAAARARPRRSQRRSARSRALPAQPRRAQRAPPRQREDPHRHHRREAQPARRGDRWLPGHGPGVQAQHREARRGARALAVRRRVLARRARVLPADHHLEVWEVGSV